MRPLGQIALLLLGLSVLVGCSRGPEDFPRVLLVAIEGADSEIIDPLVAEGRLPTFERLFKEGAHGTLFSTIPPLSPTAWFALTTGKNAGRTGVYQSAVLVPGTYQGQPVLGASAPNEKRLWHLVGDEGARVIGVNVPLSFPPTEVNGVLVCGFPADDNGVFAYPPMLAEQLRQRGYVPFFKSARMPDEYLAAIEDRADMATKYMRNLEWNLSIVCFTNLDEVCRLYIADPGPVQSAYEAVDRALGRLIETAGPETTVMVISTHGYYPHPYERYFSINRWLMEEGYLELQGWLDDSLRVIPFGEEGPKDLGFGRYQILWPKTRAFSIADCHSNYGHIQVNLRGREPSGLVERGPEYETLRQEIKRRLLNYRDPETGRQIVKHVFTREDLCSGDRVGDLPDLFFETIPGVLPLGLTFTGYFELSEVVGAIEVGRNQPFPGNFRREGVLALAGPDILPGARVDTELLNIAPTVLYLLGLPVPPDFDGSVIERAFGEEHVAAVPVRKGKERAYREKAPEFLLSPRPPDDDERALLTSLGYLH